MRLLLTDEDIRTVMGEIRKYSGNERILGELQCRLDRLMTDIDVVVDKWPDFTAVVLKRDPNRTKIELTSQLVSVFATDHKALRSLLKSREVIDWTRKHHFAGLPFQYCATIISVATSYNAPFYYSVKAVFLETTPAKLKHFAIPDGFRMSSLKPEQYGVVDKTWKFSSLNRSSSYIKHLITHLPSCCLYNREGALVGFALTFHYSAIAMLHVMEEYRRKGYAKIIVSHLAQKYFQEGREFFVAIEESNTVSIQLHISTGFEKVENPRRYWIQVNG